MASWTAASIPVADRISKAKQKLTRVVDHVQYLLGLHETNAIVSYSPALSSQIPRSHAANAFLVFQRGLHQIEIVRLCALWDSADPDKENIATVIELIDHPDVIEALAIETESHWSGMGGAVLNPSSDPVLAEAEQQAMCDVERQFGKEQGDKARANLARAIQDARNVLASTKHASVMNLRDKHLAHSLVTTRREKNGPVAAMKYGDERALLEDALPIVETLYCWVNGTSFDFTDSRGIDRRNAQALWGKCTFAVDY